MSYCQSGNLLLEVHGWWRRAPGFRYPAPTLISEVVARKSLGGVCLFLVVSWAGWNFPRTREIVFTDQAGFLGAAGAHGRSLTPSDISEKPRGNPARPLLSSAPP